MFKFRLTLLSGILLAIVVIWSAVQVGMLTPIWGLLLFVTTSFEFYQLGKSNTEYRTKNEKEYWKILNEAAQLEEIARSSSIALFPEIQYELVEKAAVKYLSIDLPHNAESIRALITNQVY
jgi:hypothetical protein